VRGRQRPSQRDSDGGMETRIRETVHVATSGIEGQGRLVRHSLSLAVLCLS
jgi:hypothetical protein